MSRKLFYYPGLFVIAFAVQWIWYRVVKITSGETPLNMLLTALLFTLIVLLVDFVGKKLRK
ncbi:MAG: hypothetical protein ABF608_11240 [Sporolactobacillus sp.]